MSLVTSVMRATFAGSAYTNATLFPVPFPFSANSHLVVTRIEASGTQTVLVLDTGYSVAGATRASGGTVSLIGSVLAAAETLIIERVAPPLQLTDFSNQGETFPETVEAALDYEMEVLQQVEDTLGVYNDSNTRVLKLAPHGVNGSSYYDARSNKISNMDDGVANQDAATLGQVLAIVGGIATGSGGFISATLTAAQVAAISLSDLTWRNKVVCVHDAGLPDVIKMFVLTSSGTTLELVTLAGATT